MGDTANITTTLTNIGVWHATGVTVTYVLSLGLQLVAPVPYGEEQMSCVFRVLQQPL
jgi:hypothetical protein